MEKGVVWLVLCMFLLDSRNYAGQVGHSMPRTVL